MNLRKIITLAVVIFIIGGTLYMKGHKGPESPDQAYAQVSGEYPELLDLGAPG
ncbi:hypothetical protein [Dethiosulfovibrio salsuginis]|uniref:Uncharacterized protein n=1 Tax=Dethiosulfovibrio salsuginis TaxID=561720 RepID=A0A1X7J6Y1_9BACT|nr:hypothetical protein [Dethiosulfovibrio salsuginis]SMG23386.1 hypothetical protein SAMN06275492_10921 [Dethiosulfovibrio salsuginis]